MKKALIDTAEQVVQVVSWELVSRSGYLPEWRPISAVIPNSWRVCETDDEEFPVTPNLFWVNCDDSINADYFFYDSVELIFKPIINAPKPA